MVGALCLHVLLQYCKHLVDIGNVKLEENLERVQRSVS